MGLGKSFGDEKGIGFGIRQFGIGERGITSRKGEAIFSRQPPGTIIFEGGPGVTGQLEEEEGGVVHGGGRGSRDEGDATVGGGGDVAFFVKGPGVDAQFETHVVVEG